MSKVPKRYPKGMSSRHRVEKDTELNTAAITIMKKHTNMQEIIKTKEEMVKTSTMVTIMAVDVNVIVVGTVISQSSHKIIGITIGSHSSQDSNSSLRSNRSNHSNHSNHSSMSTFIPQQLRNNENGKRNNNIAITMNIIAQPLGIVKFKRLTRWKTVMA